MIECHQIDETTGRAAIMVTGQAPWHKLGTVVEQAQTSAEAIKLGGLDWAIEKWPVYASDPTGDRLVKAPNAFANVRTDTRAVLGIVSDAYRVFQNAEAFEFFDALVCEKLAMYETVGSLKGGRKIWLMARLPGEYRVGDKDDITLPYVMLDNAHDGGGALRIFPTSVRTVCWNTRMLALREGRSAIAKGKGIRINHFATLGDKVKAARAALGIVSQQLDEDAEIARSLARQPLSGFAAKVFFEGLVPLVSGNSDSAKRQAKKRDELMAALVRNWSDPQQTDHGTGGTIWAAYNAVSQYADHQRPHRGKGEEQRLAGRVNSAWFGEGADLKDKAWESALAIAV
jgi:phage/plasmid-like protein (TIGR03299 family)